MLTISPEKKIWLSDPLGPPDSDEHRKFVSDAETVLNSYTEQSRDVWTETTSFWDLYLGKWPDPRDQVTERWRAHVTLPYPYSGVQAKLASLSDIFLSADPMVQAEGVEDEDVDSARATERLIDYTFRATAFSKFLNGRFSDALVQGTSFFKLVHKDIATTQYVIAGEQKRADFLKALDELEQAMPHVIKNMPDFTTDPDGFEAWRQTVNKGTKFKVPEPPYDGQRTFVRYRGPMFVPIRMWDVFLDPLIEEIDNQPWVIHRILKPRSWIEARAGKDDTMPFDRKAVDYAMSDWGGDKLSEYEQQIAEARKVSVSQASLPDIEETGELLEVWRQDEPQAETPYCVILNRKAVINKNRQFPYQHGQCSIGALRNVMVPGHFFGISELDQPKSLYKEANTLRSLRVDKVTLATMPIFTRLNSANIPELHRHFRPGVALPVPRHDVLRPLPMGSDSSDAYREIAETKNDIDETNATGQNVRGGAATVGRVSATETQGRVTQALLRTKLTAVMMSEDLHPFLNQLVTIWHQKGSADLLKRVTGGAGVAVTSAQLYEALAIDFRFRGPTRALNREMQAQQLGQFLKDYANWLGPEEMREAMKAVLEAVGMRGAGKIITQKYTDLLTQQWMQKSGLAAQAGQMQGQAMDAQQGAMNAPAALPAGPPQEGGATMPPGGQEGGEAAPPEAQPQ